MFRRGWKKADATVIVARHFVSTGSDVAGLDSKSELVVEVHPADGEAFRAEVKLSYLGFNLKQRRMSPPEVGETLHVEYDPKSHDVNVLLDESHDRKAIRKEKAEAFQAALDAPIGTATPMRADVAKALGRGARRSIDARRSARAVSQHRDRRSAHGLRAIRRGSARRSDLARHGSNGRGFGRHTHQRSAMPSDRAGGHPASWPEDLGW